MPIQLFLSTFVLAELVGFFDDVVSDRVRVDESTFRINPAVSMASNITSLVVFVAFVVTVVWVHVSATTAQRLGIPARRSPGWAVGGFLIPVVNLWWPYQSVCDLFPPGDPDRRVVGRWWALYLGASFTPMMPRWAWRLLVPRRRRGGRALRRSLPRGGVHPPSADHDGRRCPHPAGRGRPGLTLDPRPMAGRGGWVSRSRSRASRSRCSGSARAWGPCRPRTAGSRGRCRGGTSRTPGPRRQSSSRSSRWRSSASWPPTVPIRHERVAHPRSRGGSTAPAA